MTVPGLDEFLVSEQERENLERAKRIRDRLESVGLVAPTINTRIFRASGKMFGWSTQRDLNGKFFSFVRDAEGNMRDKRYHAKRKDAKARALKFYEKENADAN